MIIQSDIILAALTKKALSHAQDASRHLLCPECRVRTKLYTLKDGRKKCSVCGTKFNPGKKTDAVKLKQCADVLLCFCINFTAQQASVLSGYRYRLVAALYDDFRLLLLTQSMPLENISKLTMSDAYDHNITDKKDGKSPVFGMKIRADHIFLDPLFTDAQSAKRHNEYAGFISRGKFHRFPEGERRKDGAEQIWAWMSERLRRHHGIWKQNVGLYLKEFEWKYNNRNLTSEVQALKIIELLPDDFLNTWLGKNK